MAEKKKGSKFRLVLPSGSTIRGIGMGVASVGILGILSFGSAENFVGAIDSISGNSDRRAAAAPAARDAVQRIDIAIEQTRTAPTPQSTQVFVPTRRQEATASTQNTGPRACSKVGQEDGKGGICSKLCVDRVYARGTAPGVGVWVVKNSACVIIPN